MSLTVPLLNNMLQLLIKLYFRSYSWNSSPICLFYISGLWFCLWPGMALHRWNQFWFLRHSLHWRIHILSDRQGLCTSLQDCSGAFRSPMRKLVHSKKKKREHLISSSLLCPVFTLLCNSSVRCIISLARQKLWCKLWLFLCVITSEFLYVNG